MLYVLMREGVYQQGIFGVFEDLEEAITNGKVVISEEPDHYHRFVIYEVPLNVRLDSRDGNLVASITRTVEGIKISTYHD